MMNIHPYHHYLMRLGKRVSPNTVSVLDGQFFFLVYETSWAMYPIIFVWPILNIIFIILYVRRKKDKQD